MLHYIETCTEDKQDLLVKEHVKFNRKDAHIRFNDVLLALKSSLEFDYIIQKQDLLYSHQHLRFHPRIITFTINAL